MKVRLLLIPAWLLGLGWVGCRNDTPNPQPNAQEESPGSKRVPAGRDTNIVAAPVAGVEPRPPTVIGVNTRSIDFDGKLAGIRVAILATDGFEEAELVDPRQAYADQGASTVIVSTKTGEIQGYKHDEKADRVKVDMLIEDADPEQFDALALPGGVVNADRLRLEPKVALFVKTFAQSGKPIAAICHGLWSMADADVLRGRTVTSWPTLKTDLKNAGAKWVDQEVAVDRNFVTSRKPEDIPAFNTKAIALFAKHRAAIGGGPPSDQPKPGDKEP
jgi:protease I